MDFLEILGFTDPVTPAAVLPQKRKALHAEEWRNKHAKRAPIENIEDACSTTWASRLRNALSELWQSRGDQLRPLKCASSSSGMGTDMAAVKDA
eukprot:6491084-Amphidinium_carterae.3